MSAPNVTDVGPRRVRSPALPENDLAEVLHQLQLPYQPCVCHQLQQFFTQLKPAQFRMHETAASVLAAQPTKQASPQPPHTTAKAAQPAAAAETDAAASRVMSGALHLYQMAPDAAAAAAAAAAQPAAHSRHTQTAAAPKRRAAPKGQVIMKAAVNAAPKKAVAMKATPKKAVAMKAAPKKAVAMKAAPKKAVPMKAAPTKKPRMYFVLPRAEQAKEDKKHLAKMQRAYRQAMRQ